MYSKFVIVLSVVVLAVAAPAHEKESEIQNLEIRDVLEKTEFTNEIFDLALSIYSESMNSVYVNLPAEGSATINGLPINVFVAIPHLTGTADDLFRKLKELIDAAFDKARQAIQYAKDKVNEAADKAQDFAKQQMKGVEDGLRKEIDDVKEKAKTAGINIDDCLAGNEDRLLDLPNKYSGELVHCVSDQVNKAIGYADDALNKIQDVVNTVTNIKQEIEDCGSGFKAFICLTGLGVKIAKDIVVLPLEIEADVTSAVTSITRITGEVEKCGKDKLSEMAKEGKDIMTAVTVCVAAKGL